MTWAPTLRPALAWREARRAGGDDAARAAIAHGLDTRAAWNAETSEARLADAALRAGTIDTVRLVALAVAAAASVEKRGRSIADDLADANERAAAEPSLKARRTLATVAANAHAALAGGKCWPALVWAADAALLASTGDTDDARFAALEALRAVGDAPGRVDRWASACPMPSPASDPHTLIELVVDSAGADDRAWIGFRARKPLPDPTALDAFQRVAEDTIDPSLAPLAMNAGRVLARSRGVCWTVIPVGAVTLETVAAHEWAQARIVAGGVQWRISPDAPEPRISPENDALYGAVEEAILDVTRDTPWERLAVETRRTNPRRMLLRITDPDARQPDGWRWSMVAGDDPEAMARELRARR